MLQRLISAKLFFSPYYGKTEILNVALPFMSDACGGVSSGEQSWPKFKKSSIYGSLFDGSFIYRSGSYLLSFYFLLFFFFLIGLLFLSLSWFAKNSYSYLIKFI